MNLQLFAEGDPAPQPEPNTDPIDPQPEPNTDPAPQLVDFAELLKTNKDFQAYVDRAVTDRTKTAVQNAIQKQQRLNDEKLSESERLKEMTAEQRAVYFEQKFKDLEKARSKDKEVESMKEQTVSMLGEHGIPAAFLGVFDFDGATAEDIRQRVGMLSEYEYYPKGELAKRVSEGVNDRLKGGSIPKSGGADPAARAYSMADIGKMTPDQINKNWDTIAKSLNGGK
jgi:hypothetical protein